MQSQEEGGYYSAEDADSEGVEGKFYVWTRKEIFSLLPEEVAIQKWKKYWLSISYLSL